MSRTPKSGKRSPKDQYFTPHGCITPIVNRLRDRVFDFIIDVGAGDGRIIAEIFNTSYRGNTEFYAVEPFYPLALPHSEIKHRFQTFQDFCTTFSPESDERILCISNPPYSELNEIHPMMIDLVLHGGYGSMLILLLRLDYLAGKTRTKSGVYDSPLEMTNIFTLSPRVRFSNSTGSDSGDYAWICWEKKQPPLGRHHESWLWKK